MEEIVECMQKRESTANRSFLCVATREPMNPAKNNFINFNLLQYFLISVKLIDLDFALAEYEHGNTTITKRGKKTG